MKINLGNGIVLEEVTAEDVKQIVKDITTPTVTAARVSVTKTKKSTCNNKLDGRRKQVCSGYFVEGLSTNKLGDIYGVTPATIIYTLKSRGPVLGYLTEEDVDSYTAFKGKC